MDYKRFFQDRLRLLKAITVNSYQIDTAYFFDTWTNGISTVVFTGAYLVFIQIVFSNVKTLAGYNRNEVFFLAFLTQLNFYVLSAWSLENMKRLGSNINLGDLDLVLSKPVPALFYITLPRIYFLDLIRDSIVPLLMVVVLIDWSVLHVTWLTASVALIIFIAGQLCIHCVHFLLAIASVWLGEAEQVFNLSYALNSSDVVPYEGLPGGFKIALTTIFPVAVPTALAATVALGKSPWLPMLVLALASATGFLLLKSWVWKQALKNYTSASS